MEGSNVTTGGNYKRKQKHLDNTSKGLLSRVVKTADAEYKDDEMLTL